MLLLFQGTAPCKRNLWVKISPAQKFWVLRTCKEISFFLNGSKLQNFLNLGSSLLLYSFTERKMRPFQWLNSEGCCTSDNVGRYLDMVNQIITFISIHHSQQKTGRVFSKERSIFVIWKITPSNNLRIWFGSTARVSHAGGVPGKNSPPVNELLAWIYLPPCAMVKDFMGTHGRCISIHYYETREENYS